MSGISFLLKPEIQSFILENTGKDASGLALKKNPFPGCDYPEILNQVAARTKAKTKLPHWFTTEKIIYPAKVSLEQTSSEATAAYKSGLVSGGLLIDLTGGFGVDDFYFSRRVQKVFHCEINPALSQIVAHNFRQLKVENIDFKTGDSLSVLQLLEKKADWIYVDPSRRNEAKGKVFLLSDCLPAVPDLLQEYFRHTGNILLKTAPWLDIAAGLSELKFVSEVHVVAVENEVKELLWILKKNHSGSVNVKTAELSKNADAYFDFVMDDAAQATFSLPKAYLYEPNAAIMKSGGFAALSQKLNLAKLHPNSHLYTADTQVGFPGRVFRLEHSLRYTKTEMKRFLEGKQANIAARNFPETVAEIRKRWKIRDGGQQYCFFTTDVENRKIVLLCSKIFL